MEECGLFLLLLLSFVVSSRAYGFMELHIDCGAITDTPITDDGLFKWVTDGQYIKTGQNSVLAFSQNFSVMNTLRFFPNGNKSCYELPSNDIGQKFLFRAGFYYGNYDGLNKPPSFNLELDGNLWATVTTSGSEDEPVFHEMIYTTATENTSVCLVRTGNDVPFISSLEAALLYSNAYTEMKNNTALYLHSRINYGANKSIDKLIDHSTEPFIREWTSKQMQKYLNITQSYITQGYLIGENDPPWPVMATAVQAENVTDSIHLTVNFSTQTQEVAYFVLYFMDPIAAFRQNQSGKVDIYINNQKLNTTDIPPLGSRTEYNVVTLYPVQVSGSANVTLSPAQNSTLAPLLNAMEVFTVINVASKGETLHILSIFLSGIFLHLLTVLVLYC